MYFTHTKVWKKHLITGETPYAYLLLLLMILTRCNKMVSFTINAHQYISGVVWQFSVRCRAAVCSCLKLWAGHCWLWMITFIFKNRSIVLIKLCKLLLELKSKPSINNRLCAMFEIHCTAFIAVVAPESKEQKTESIKRKGFSQQLRVLLWATNKTLQYCDYHDVNSSKWYVNICWH